MHHIIEHIKSNDKDPTVNKSGNQSKDILQVNPSVPDNEALYISNLMQRAKSLLHYNIDKMGTYSILVPMI